MLALQVARHQNILHGGTGLADVWDYDQRIGQLLRGPGELTQQRAPSLAHHRARQQTLGDEVHTVVQAADSRTRSAIVAEYRRRLVVQRAKTMGWYWGRRKRWLMRSASSSAIIQGAIARGSQFGWGSPAATKTKRPTSSGCASSSASTARSLSSIPLV